MTFDERMSEMELVCAHIERAHKIAIKCNFCLPTFCRNIGAMDLSSLAHIQLCLQRAKMICVAVVVVVVWFHRRFLSFSNIFHATFAPHISILICNVSRMWEIDIYLQVSLLHCLLNSTVVLCESANGEKHQKETLISIFGCFGFFFLTFYKYFVMWFCGMWNYY